MQIGMETVTHHQAAKPGIHRSDEYLRWIFGYFFAGELLSIVQLFGAGLILSGMLLAEVGSYIALWLFKRKHSHQ